MRHHMLALVSGCLFGAILVASVDSPVAGQQKADPKDRATTTKDRAVKDEAAMVRRANEIAGMKVKNMKGQDLGKVEDVVIDVKTGRVRYAAISFGGFLGVGDKLFAVPFQALKLQHDQDDDKSYFAVNIDKGILEKAKGFDQKNWPDFGNPRYSEENDKFFSTPQGTTSTQPGNRTVTEGNK